MHLFYFFYTELLPVGLSHSLHLSTMPPIRTSSRQSHPPVRYSPLPWTTHVTTAQRRSAAQKRRRDNERSTAVANLHVTHPNQRPLQISRSGRVVRPPVPFEIDEDLTPSRQQLAQRARQRQRRQQCLIANRLHHHRTPLPESAPAVTQLTSALIRRRRCATQIPPSSPVPLALRQLADNTSVRHYLGKLDTICPCCKALHWEGERSSSAPQRSHSDFRTCCRFGSVDLRPFPRPPAVLENLYRGGMSRHYMGIGAKSGLRHNRQSSFPPTHSSLLKHILFRITWRQHCASFHIERPTSIQDSRPAGPSDWESSPLR